MFRNPGWRQAFGAEARAIRGALGGLAVAVHCIRSTAVPGLHAKSINDVLLDVHDIQRLNAHAPALEALGYEGLGECGLPGRRYLREERPPG